MIELATVPTPDAEKTTASWPDASRSSDQALCCAIDIVDFVQRLPALPQYIPHPSFDDPDLERGILAPMPQVEEFETRRREMKMRRGGLPELASLFGMPLLSKDQEQHLFRQMNYLKYKAA